jgi:hypothetical protein
MDGFCGLDEDPAILDGWSANITLPDYGRVAPSLAQNRWHAVCSNVPEIVLAGERASRGLEVEGVDFLGSDVTQQ